MTKQDLSTQISELGVTKDIEEQLVARVDLYPDALEEKHLKDFEGLLMKLEQEEYRIQSALGSAARTLETAIEKDEQTVTRKLQKIAEETQESSDQLASMSASAN